MYMHGGRGGACEGLRGPHQSATKTEVQIVTVQENSRCRTFKLQQVQNVRDIACSAPAPSFVHSFCGAACLLVNLSVADKTNITLM